MSALRGGDLMSASRGGDAMTSPKKRRRVIAALAWVLFAATPPTSARATPVDFFTLVAGASLVATGTVTEVTESAADGIVTYDIAIEQVLSGTPAGAAVVVVQDMIFPSDRAFFARGDTRLFAFEPLPSSSRYASLSRGVRLYRVREGRHGARGAAAVPAARSYLLAGRAAPPQRGRERVSALVAALHGREVGDDAVRALAVDATPAREFSGADVAAIAGTLGDRDLPTERRRALLDVVAAKRLDQVASEVRALLDEPDMAPFARRALAVFGEAPRADDVLADLLGADPAARRAALESAEALPRAERIALLGEVASADSDYALRAEAITALARTGREAVPALAALVDDGDQRIAYSAARGLAATGGPESIEVLSSALAGTNHGAQVAAIFALREMGSPDALRILREKRTAEHDPRLERVLDVVLGVGGHEH